MEITKINSTNEFDKLTKNWRTLNVYQFGPLLDIEDNEDVQVLVIVENDECVAYLIAEDTELWHIETKDGHNGKGYASQLAIEAQIDYAYEVCSDAGANFCEKLDIEYDDCR